MVATLTKRAAAPQPLSPEELSALASRLGHWRRAPLTPEALAALLPRVQDPQLALAVAERLAMAGPMVVDLLLELSRREGIDLPLIRALGICHHPRARDQLLAWLPAAGTLEPAVLEALACWGQQVDLAIIEAALIAPGQAHRLAGLQLLSFRSRSLAAAPLLALCQPLLQDLRAAVVIATVRLLQRRQEEPILAAIQACIDPQALPGVAEAAIQALGCIATPGSRARLQALEPLLRGSRLEAALQRELAAQVHLCD